MSVTFVRSALMVPGKFPQAHEYLEKRIKWLKEKFGVEASLMVLLGGQVGRIATVTEEDSVAQIEKIRRDIVGGVHRMSDLGMRWSSDHRVYSANARSCLCLADNMPIRCIGLACCARAASVHDAAAPPRSVMKSRRLLIR